ncbi:MAG: helix-turn-helix domain-containing protein [Candidatus Moraniibacteriota bacterium]
MDKQIPQTGTAKELLTIREVAELFGVHQQTLRRWDEEGKLKAVRVGKFGHRKYHKTDVDKLLKVC